MHSLTPLHLNQPGRAECREILWKSKSLPISILELVEPTVIWDAAKKIVPFIHRLESAEFVLQIVPSSALQSYSIYVEPGSPEDSTNPGHVPVERATSLCAATELDNTLHVEVYDANGPISSEQTR